MSTHLNYEKVNKCQCGGGQEQMKVAVLEHEASLVCTLPTVKQENVIIYNL